VTEAVIEVTVTTQEKFCSRCQESKPTSEFWKWSQRDGLQPHCKECQKKTRKPRTSQSIQKHNLRALHGLSIERFLTMLVLQDSRCAICEEDFPPYDGKVYACVDHDHRCCSGRGSCGECIRGLLCNLCNLGLGQFKDESSLLFAAGNYLKATNV
jgi:hypothetical protein